MKKVEIGQVEPVSIQPGTLFVVATPIGNLGDLTRRAVETLGRIDLIACEDTRRTLKLLRHLGLEKPLMSCHGFNERRRCRQLLDILHSGKEVALLSDAGTPMVSDPGGVVVRACAAAGIRVVPVPGPSALAAALSVCHFPAEPFLFAGFPPARSGQRRRFLAELASCPYSVVFYEAPHRIAKTLEDLLEVFGDRECLFCRELTKIHEETLRLSLAGLTAVIAGRPAVKGEITLVVAGATDAAPSARKTPSPGEPQAGSRLKADKSVSDKPIHWHSQSGAGKAGGPAAGEDEALRTEYLSLKAQGRRSREIIEALGARSGLPRNTLYRLILRWDRQRKS